MDSLGLTWSHLVSHGLTLSHLREREREREREKGKREGGREGQREREAERERERGRERREGGIERETHIFS